MASERSAIAACEEEAEPLLRQAIEIDKNSLSLDNPG
jgi:hypothetical protein